MLGRAKAWLYLNRQRCENEGEKLKRDRFQVGLRRTDYSEFKSYVATRATLVMKELRHKIHHNLGNWEILKAFEFL